MNRLSPDAAPPPARLPASAPPDVVAVPRQTVRRRRRSRRLGWGLAGLSLALLAALAVVAYQNGRAINDALGQHSAYLLHLEATLRDVPLLSDDELAALRRSRNARHVELAETYGLQTPPVTRAGIDSLVAAGALVALPAGSGYVAWDGEHSDPVLTAGGAASLDSVALRFGERLDRLGLPRVQFTVSSVLRSDEDQEALRGVNSNAAAGRSSHSYGTTYDITYRRYSWAGDEPPPPPPLDGVPALTRALLADHLAAQRAQAFARHAEEYPSRYDALLGRALIELEDEGVVAVVRERRQPVYHITAAADLGGDATPSARPGILAP